MGHARHSCRKNAGNLEHPESHWKAYGHLVGNHVGLSLSECYKTFVKSGSLSLRGKGFKGCSHLCGIGLWAPSSFPSWVYPFVCLFRAAFGILRTPCLRGGKSGRSFLLFYLIKLLQPESAQGCVGAHGYEEGARKNDGDLHFWQQNPLWHFVHLNQHVFFFSPEGFGALSSRPTGSFQAPNQHLSPRYVVEGYLSSPSS